MPRRRKHFDCGHEGFGQFCRPCSQAAQQRKQLDDARLRERQARAELEERWRTFFSAQDRDFDTFPDVVARKAIEIAAAATQGEHFSTLKGRHLRFDREKVRFDLPLHYRLVCREGPEGLTELEVMPHEQYNHLFAGRGR